MNQAPTQKDTKPRRAKKHLQSTAVGLVNQAFTQYKEYIYKRGTILFS